jgi:hypothetical protein
MDCLGGCHCGNVHVRLRLTKPPEDNLLRACTCSFCRSHNPRMLSDPEGSFEVRADNWSLVERYRFGSRTCMISSSAVAAECLSPLSRSGARACAPSSM